jgi:pimeloyl-ACP methyl ester carboxylesterase
MRALNVTPTLSLFSSLGMASWGPLQTLVRTTEERWRPRLIEVHRLSIADAQLALLGRPAAVSDHPAVVHREGGTGRVPTIVLGGLVPDSTEQVFLLRRFLVKSGSIYYINYPHNGFSLDLICAQLSDLVAELTAAGQKPVVLGVSFGAGVLLEWLRRGRETGREPMLAGVVLISPVACVADLVEAGVAKPSTLIARALQPILDPSTASHASSIEKARAIFLRMFDAGAQNKSALRMLMTPKESERLRGAIQGTIKKLSRTGALERVGALKAMRDPTNYFTPRLLPLSSAPALILFAECEDTVLAPAAPVKFALEGAHGAYFAQGTARRVVARPGSPPVQHASLVFHVFEFLAPLQSFYQTVHRMRLALAA